MYEKRKYTKFFPYHECLSCRKIITYRFAICAECEETYGHSALEWPAWLRYAWNDEQKHRRKETKDAKNEVLFTDLYPPIEKQQMKYDDEDTILDMITINEHIQRQPEEIQLTLGLRSMGYTQGELAEIMGVSRTTIGTKLKRIRDVLCEKGLI